MSDTGPIVIILYEGVSAAEAMGALSAAHASGLRAELAAHDALVTTSEGARIVPHGLGYAHIATASAVVIPGGDPRKALVDAPLLRELRARRGHWTLAAGEGIRIAAASGLVEGRRIARRPGDAAIESASENAASRLVADGRLLTSFPGDPIVDLVLHFVARHHGDTTAQRAAHTLGREAHTFALGAQHHA